MLFDLLVVSAAVVLNGQPALAQRGTPCQSVSSMSSEFMSMFPEATEALVPAKAAADCLATVPIDVDEDKALIEELQLYLGWQSNLAYLAKPPKGYKSDRVDTVAQLSKIYDDLDGGKYEDEWTLQRDMRLAFDQSYDFHLNWNPDILEVFTFRRGNVGFGLVDEFGLVSVSKDGKEVPEIYNYYDLWGAASEGWTPSPIVKINDKDAVEFLEDWSVTETFSEDHARYQRNFRSQAMDSMGVLFTPFGRSWLYDGESTVIEYKNGTTQELINTASVPLDTFDFIEDGEDFFATFCNLGPPQTSSKRKRDLGLPMVQKRGIVLRDERLQRKEEATKTKRQNSEPTQLGYPSSVFVNSGGDFGGYYLTGKGYDDVAVLSVPNFGPSDVEEFQDLTGQFLDAASGAGKKRLVIDLRGNGGGTLFLAYDMFKQLFPSKEPFGATRFRATQAFNITGVFINAFMEANGYTYERALRDFRANGIEGEYASAYQGMFNYRVPLSVNNDNFTSWEEYFGPHEHNGDNFTTVARWDLNNFFSDDLGLDVTGYASRANELKRDQPFEGKNIVMLMDGVCGSTCAVFAEYAKIQGGVETVVIGGKPKKGPMQGVAGSKGSEVLTFDAVRRQALIPYRNLVQYQERLNNTDIGRIIFAHRPLLRTAWSSAGAASRINLRDHMRIGEEETPLEFIYEAADCRLFYTADMIFDVEAVWKKTADARWSDKKVCVEDSTGDKSSLSGGQKTADQIGDWSPDDKGGDDKKKGAASRIGGEFAAVVVAVAAMMVLL